MKRIISLTLILVITLLTLLACTIDLNDVVGTWEGHYTNNGDDFEKSLVLREDGYYGLVTSKNGTLIDTESGEYEIEGKTVILYDSSATTYHGMITEYKYKNGYLLNGAWKLSKTD